MSDTSPIQWCNGTVNPVMGCAGCELWRPVDEKSPRRSCYAAILTDNKHGKSRGYPPTFAQVTRFPGRMKKAAAAPDLRGLKRPDKPWLDGMPRVLFVSDMGDALSRSVSFEYLYTEIVEVVRSVAGQRHVWMWLTKRPRRMAEFSAYVGAGCWPANLWVGTTISEYKYRGRGDRLLAVGDSSTTRFLSVEPQVSPVFLTGEFGGTLDGIALVIQGGESGPTKPGKLTEEQFAQRKARPFDLDWARQIRDECLGAKVKYFLKQLGSAPVEDGKPVKLRDSHGGDWSEWPEDLRVREMPRGAQGSLGSEAQRLGAATRCRSTTGGVAAAP